MSNTYTLPPLNDLRSKPRDTPLRVLMICTGNICRSPTAHGVLGKMVADAGLSGRISVDSAGTHGYHVGEPPDRRSQQHAARRGYDLSAQRARQLSAQDFEQFDLLLIMDSANEQAASRIAPADQLHKMQRLTAFCRQHQSHEVPDPYYDGEQGFEKVLNVIEDACAGVLEQLRR